MLFLRSFINLLIVPLVGMYLHYKKNSTKIVLCMETIAHYCIFVTCNIPITRLFTYIVRVITGFNIEADSSYYTVAALVSVYLMPYIYQILKKLKEEDD